MNDEIIITNHAYKMAKKRFKWNKSALNNVSKKAYKNGLDRLKVKGRTKKYINKIWGNHKSANNIKIYGQNIFLFNSNILITLYRIPNSLIKYL